MPALHWSWDEENQVICSLTQPLRLPPGAERRGSSPTPSAEERKVGWGRPGLPPFCWPRVPKQIFETGSFGVCGPQESYPLPNVRGREVQFFQSLLQSDSCQRPACRTQCKGLGKSLWGRSQFPENSPLQTVASGLADRRHPADSLPRALC